MTDIISVSQYLDGLNATLREKRAKIVGEISELKEYPGKSYLFFSLKDTKDGSCINCIMFKNDYRISGVEMRDGLEVIVTATPEVWKPNGRMTFKVDSVELVGEGALQKAYEELKKKLDAEGLFAITRKREIPSYPSRIGVITSKSGAVINDFLSNIGKFGFEILFVDSKVEGQDATKDLLASIKTLENKGLDVLVIMRGGGSLESFLAFNNEVLVRAVADFPAPVLTGIGHDKDISLVAMASDRNVSTPTAVANLLNSSWNEAISQLELAEEKILSRFSKLLDTFKRAEALVLNATVRIESGIIRTKDVILQKEKDILRGFELLSAQVKDFIVQSAKSLELSSPERALAQGYSIVRHNGKVIRKRRDVRKGETLDILVSDGSIESKVI